MSLKALCEVWRLALAVLVLVAVVASRGSEFHAGNSAAGVTPVPVLYRYGSLPKGVVLEDSAEGMEPVSSITYDKARNEFMINNTATYANPVTRQQFQRIVRSIYKDDRIGVTLILGEPTTFGSFEKDDEITKNLSETDKVLGGVLYGMDHLLVGMKLPGDYKPLKAPDRKIPVIATTIFHGYGFEKRGNAYVRSRCSIDVTLFPLSVTQHTKDGGHLPDSEATKSFVIEETDKANIAHLKQHEAEYSRIMPFSKTFNFGEAAAFARHLRDSKIKLDAVLAQLK